MAEIVDIRNLMEEAGESGVNRVEFEARKIYLSGFMDTCAEVEERMMEIERMDASLYPGMKKLDGMPRGSRGKAPDNGVENCIVSYAKLRRGVRQEAAKLAKERDKIRAAIDSAPTSQMRRILNLRYADEMKWEDIAQKMNYSVRQVQNIHDKAIKKIKVPKEAISIIVKSILEGTNEAI